MEAIRLTDLIQAVSGRVLGGTPSDTALVREIRTDNRQVEEGDVFFAFVGEKINAHRFVDAAFEAGAAACVVQEVPEKIREDRVLILVEDTIKAYGDLAAWYRSRFRIPVIGVTGSVGKTTTKDMLAAVLEQKYRVLKTQGNFNNNIGLPRTLLGLESGHEMAVVEMGMNHLGEISCLTRIARPSCAVITNIGDAHIGNLGSRENILRAKCEIFEGLSGDGFAILNGDDDLLPGRTYPCPVTWIGAGEGCQVRAEDIDDSFSEKLTFTAKTPAGSFPVTVPQPGYHMIYSVLTAIAAGLAFGLAPEEICAGIESYVPTKMRMNIERLSGNTAILNDAYNANTASMKAALRILSRREESRKIAVLGDMLEQGDMEEALHREVGRAAAEFSPDILVTVGRAAGYIAEEAGKAGLARIYACRDQEEARAVLKDLAGPDTAFLFKASRGMRLEDLAAFVKGCLEEA